MMNTTSASSSPTNMNTTSTTVLGITFDPNDPAVLLEYSLVNMVVTSVIPFPLAGPMVGISALLFGVLNGMVVNTLTSVVGAYISLLATRSACRPCFTRMLGRYRQRWVEVDAAITAEGYQIALLIRIAPISPMVATNVLLSLTSISTRTYLWTCAVGIIPANLPYAYAAQLGASLAEEFPPRDPLMLSMSILGFVASVAIACKVGSIAKKILRRHGVGASTSGRRESAERPVTPACEGGADELELSAAAIEADLAAEGAAAEAAAERRQLGRDRGKGSASVSASASASASSGSVDDSSRAGKPDDSVEQGSLDLANGPAAASTAREGASSATVTAASLATQAPPSHDKRALLGAGKGRGGRLAFHSLQDEEQERCL